LVTLSSSWSRRDLPELNLRLLQTLLRTACISCPPITIPIIQTNIRFSNVNSLAVSRLCVEPPVGVSLGTIDGNRNTRAKTAGLNCIHKHMWSSTTNHNQRPAFLRRAFARATRIRLIDPVLCLAEVEDLFMAIAYAKRVSEKLTGTTRICISGTIPTRQRTTSRVLATSLLSQTHTTTFSVICRLSTSTRIGPPKTVWLT
jgi:hypothetical protein